ncbi:MAG: hypothetical protein ACREQY_11720, partial [Candidatus Binatia bacterium]
VDIVMELFAMSASVARAQRMKSDRDPTADQAIDLADLFCRQARIRVKQSFRALWRNEDVRLNALAARVMDGRYTWLEEGRLPMFPEPDAFKTRAITSIFDGAPETPKASDGAGVRSTGATAVGQ